MADCDHIISMSPAQGFAVHEVERREGEFRDERDRDVRVKVTLICVGGAPELRERTED